MKTNNSGLGLVASSKRNILDGMAFNGFFPKNLGTDPFFTQNGDVNDTVEYCAKIVEKTANDTKLITKYLLAKSKDLNSFCKNVFDFAFHHFQYEQDKKGVEQVRRPARAWKDRKEGIDCDCFSILCGQILYNAGIPFAFRIVKMYGRTYFQHIYVIVPKNKNFNLKDLQTRENYYVIDPVLDKYDFEAPKITETQDRIMKPLTFNNNLNGIEGSTQLGEEFEGLGISAFRNFKAGTGKMKGFHVRAGHGKGIHPDYHKNNANGETYYRHFLKSKKKYLQHTRDLMNKDPKRFSHIYNTPKLAGMYDQLIGAWDDDNSREAMLNHLSGIEEQALRPELQGLGHIIHGPESEFYNEMLNGEFELDGLGKFGDKFRERLKRLKTKTRGVFTKMKNTVKTFKEDIRNLKSKEGRKAMAEKLLHNFLKFNPGTIPIRAGFLVGMKTNIFKIASRLYWGTFPKEVAVKAGVDPDYWERAHSAYENTQKFFYGKLGGDLNNLEHAIKTGRAAHKNGQSKKLNGLDALNNMNGLGEYISSGAIIVAGLSALTAVANSVGKSMKTPSGKEATEKGGERAPVVISIPQAQAQTQQQAQPEYQNQEESQFTESY